MKTFLSILGGCFFLILVIVGVALAIFIPRGMKLDHEAETYVQTAVPKIVSPWNSQALIDCATPELMATVQSPEDIPNLFNTLRRFGSLKHLDAPKGTTITTAFMGKGTATLGNYTVPAEFENGKAVISIQIKLEGDQWRINGFHVNGNRTPGKAPPISA